MKRLMMILLLLAISSPAFAQTSTSASQLRIKLYKMWFSASGLCTDAVLVVDNGSSPDLMAITQGGTEDMGTGDIADGTYPCVIFKISDFIYPTPIASLGGGACEANVEYRQDIFQSWGGQVITSECPDDTTASSDGAEEQQVCIYISTYATWEGGDSSSNNFTPPTSDGDSEHGIKLQNAAVVAGTTSTGTLTFNLTDKIITRDDSGTTVCDMQPPGFGFAMD